MAGCIAPIDVLAVVNVVCNTVALVALSWISFKVGAIRNDQGH